MRVILKAGLLAISVETDEEQEAFAAWRESMRDHVFHFDGGSVRGGAFQDLGPRPDACREPINVVSDMRPPTTGPQPVISSTRAPRSSRVARNIGA